MPDHHLVPDLLGDLDDLGSSFDAVFARTPGKSRVRDLLIPRGSQKIRNPLKPCSEAESLDPAAG